ncbi:MAG: hypothetical protein M3O21_05265 [Chloroflexota bacterium]|nr:hypothetical protein [Chloroflexota bacterium]
MPVLFFDLAAAVLVTLYFLRLGIFLPSAFVAFGAVLLLCIIYNHRFIVGAKNPDWNFVELRETYFVVRVAQLFGPAQAKIRYENVDEVRVAQRVNLVWRSVARYGLADFWPHVPAATTMAGLFGPTPHVEVKLKRAILIPLGGNRLFPFVTVLHFGVDDPVSLSAQLMMRCGLMD